MTNELENILKSNSGFLPIDVKIKFLNDKAQFPTYANEGDVGMDLTCTSIEYDELHDVYNYHTGISLESDYHYGLLIFPRSSIRKKDCYLSNSVGVIDTAIYRGEIIFCFKPRISLFERSNIVGMKAYMKALEEDLPKEQEKDRFKIAKEKYEITKQNVIEMTKKLEYAPYKIGDKIGQMVIIPRTVINLISVSKLSDSVRGTNGFGSSGE